MRIAASLFARWQSVESSRTAAGLHYRDLHIPIGGSPTAEQQAATTDLLHPPDFTTDPRSTLWLSDFLASTLIPESTYGEAFTGIRNNLSKLLVIYILLYHCCPYILRPPLGRFSVSPLLLS